jgi:hypothetical protein
MIYKLLVVLDVLIDVYVTPNIIGVAIVFAFPLIASLGINLCFVSSSDRRDGLVLLKVSAIVFNIMS